MSLAESSVIISVEQVQRAHPNNGNTILEASENNIRTVMSKKTVGVCSKWSK